MSAWREPVLVTGAGGFIGRYLVQSLDEAGVSVYALMLPGEPVPTTWSADVRIVIGDVTDRHAMRKALSGAGTVFHLAAVVGDWGAESLFQKVTVGGTANVLEAAAESGTRAVLASSIVVYGHRLGTDACHEGLDFGDTFGPYGRSKQAQEKLAWDLVHSAGLELTVVRPANVFGVGSRPWVEMVLPLLHRRDPTLIGGGHGNAGLCHVRNLVDLLLRAGLDPVAVGRTYNGADGSDVTWRRYFSDLAEIVGAPKPRSIPRWAAGPAARVCEFLWYFLKKEERPPLTREALNLAGSHHRISITKAHRELGYEPNFTYDEAIAELRAALQA